MMIRTMPSVWLSIRSALDTHSALDIIKFGVLMIDRSPFRGQKCSMASLHCTLVQWSLRLSQEMNRSSGRAILEEAYRQRW